jgi:predicted transcriptional regulator
MPYPIIYYFYRPWTYERLHHNAPLMLYDGGGRCCDLAERSGKSQNYVHRYLRNLRKYGLAFKNEAFWFLTPKGVEFVKYLDFVNNKILEYRKKVERK